MRRSSLFGAWLAALALCAGPAPAQEFRGEGARRTRAFPLDAGEFVIELWHRGNDDFTVRLLDENGALVRPLVAALGPFNGARRFTLERRGFYILDVEADDDWTARIRSAAELAAEKANLTPAQADSIEYERGREEGESAANALGFPWGWAARGLAGGALTGPIGIAVVAGRAGRARVDPPAGAKSAPGLAPSYLEGFDEGFARRAQIRRKEAAMVGGLVGTGILGYFVLRALDLTGASARDGSRPKPGF